MPKYQRAPQAVADLAKIVLLKHETHKSLLDAKVTIDFALAFGDTDDDTGERTGDAITKNGVKCLGLTRKIPLKDRVLGRADAEILLDGDWWNEDADAQEQEALLDHELHHISLKVKKGAVVYDDIGRPELKLRKHDYELGLFTIVAKRNGQFSQECIQMRTLMDESGQIFWPDIERTTVELSTPDGHTTGPIPANRFNRIVKEMSGAVPA